MAISQARIWDAVVVGAGPAGSTAAWHLARGGARVAVVDRVAPPRYKTCGGGVVQRARRHFPVDVGAAVERECHRARLSLLESGLVYQVERDMPVVSMVMRDRLDRLLVEAACSEGAELIAPCRLERIDDDGTLRLATDRGTLATDHVIAADGATGAVARLAGWPTLAGVPALEWEIGPSSDLARFSEAVRFDFEIGANGYAWVFPKGNRLSVGLLSVNRGAPGLAPRLMNYLRRLGIHDLGRVERHGYVIPIRPRTDGFTRGRILLVGDAAGLVDPVTCEGISHASLSGRLAAESILSGSAGGDYERRLESSILGELHAARRLARVLYRPGLRRLAFRLAGQRLCEAMVDVICGEREYADLLATHPTFAMALRLLR